MFEHWLKMETGLSLYDFRALDVFGSSEKEVKDFFNHWIESVDPIPAVITKAIESAAEYGFDVLD